MVKPEKYFFLADGRILKNLRELALRLDEFSDELFRSHVNPDKNDFASKKKKKEAQRQLQQPVQYRKTFCSYVLFVAADCS